MSLDVFFCYFWLQSGKDLALGAVGEVSGNRILLKKIGFSLFLPNIYRPIFANSPGPSPGPSQPFLIFTISTTTHLENQKGWGVFSQKACQSPFKASFLTRWSSTRRWGQRSTSTWSTWPWPTSWWLHGVLFTGAEHGGCFKFLMTQLSS